MADKGCVQRLQKEFKALCREPVPHVLARPSPSDILDWHYVLEGSEGTPFEGGVYYGKLKFPQEYPFKPPGISMVTPNGRFATHKRICMSMSDFHPESWNPMWSIGSILTGMLSFMMDNAPTTGSVNSTAEEKKILAAQSLAFNVKCAPFRKIFPEYVEKHAEQVRLKKEDSAAKSADMEPEASGNEGGGKGSVKSRKKGGNAADGGQGRHGGYGQTPKHSLKKKLPAWLMALLMTFFAGIVALPFLSLDLRS